MLENTIATDVVPGTNLAGDLACADWRFILPSLEYRVALIIGVPPLKTRKVLSRGGGRIYFVMRNARELREARDGCIAGVDDLVAVRTNKLSALPFRDASTDLIYVVGTNAGSDILQDEAVIQELARLLTPSGGAFCECYGSIGSIILKNQLRRGRPPGTTALVPYWLTPSSGEVRTAVPLEDRAVAAYFLRSVLYGQSRKTRVISRLGRIINAMALLRHVPLRCGVIMRGLQSKGHRAVIPEYLVSAIRSSGIDPSGLRFGLSARGTYNTNKAIVFLFEERAREPCAVLKITRAAEFNSRLENEYRTLKQLEENKLAQPGTYPQALFLGYHCNLAMLCEMAVRGVPFRACTKATADCPIARGAIEWLINLGAASASGAVASHEVSRVLGTLYERFAAIYTLSKEEQKILAGHVMFNGHSQKGFPIVFQHGDPGTWNIFVTQEDKVIFMDWEAGEPRGIPLWDLFYFFRTYGSWISRTCGIRDMLRSFQDLFLEDSKLGGLLHVTIRRYCELIGLDENMIESLFYTCWMHRAWKEAATLSKDSLDKGRYVGLLRFAIKNRNAVGFKRLLSGSGAIRK